MERSKRLTASISIVGATLLWGTTYPTIKFGLSVLNLTPQSFLSLRFFIALLSMFGLLLFKQIRQEVYWALGKADIILLGVFNGIAYSLQFMGQVWTTAGIATILINMYVLYTPIFGHIILGQKINWSKKIAVIVGFMGVIIIALGDILTLGTSVVTFIGIVLLFTAGIFVGLYVSYSEKVYLLEFNEKRLSPVSIFFSSSVLSFCMILIIALIKNDLPQIKGMNIYSLLPAIYLGFGCTSAAFILYLYAVRELGAVNSAVFMLLQIVISIGSSYFLLNEIPDSFMYIGSALIFAAIYLTKG